MARIWIFRVFALRLSAGINVPILRRIWIRFQGASMGAYSLYVPMDATGENGFKDKQDWDIYSCRSPQDAEWRHPFFSVQSAAL
jgi:hypothetical protein